METRLRTVAEVHGGVFSSADARSVDVDDPTLRALVRADEVVRVRRGAHVLGQVWAAAEHEAALRLRTLAVLRTRGDDVATHQAALALHRLPLHGVRLDVVDVQSPVSRVRLAAGLRTQPGALAHTTVDGARCVAIEHAIVQVLLRSGMESALVPLDHALRTKVCTLSRVEAALGFSPRSQVTICDERDAFVARVDFLVEGRVVVEFDGLQRYAGADGRAALAAEKRREDRLRSLGYVVVRLVWADLTRPSHVADLLRRALAQAASTSA